MSAVFHLPHTDAGSTEATCAVPQTVPDAVPGAKPTAPEHGLEESRPPLRSSRAQPLPYCCASGGRRPRTRSLQYDCGSLGFSASNPHRSPESKDPPTVSWAALSAGGCRPSRLRCDARRRRRRQSASARPCPPQRSPGAPPTWRLRQPHTPPRLRPSSAVPLDPTQLRLAAGMQHQTRQVRHAPQHSTDIYRSLVPCGGPPPQDG